MLNNLEDFENKQHLVKLLLECPSIRDLATLNTLVHELPNYIQNAIRQNDIPQAYVLNIVNTCFNYDNGFKDFIDILSSFDDETIQFRELTNFIDTIVVPTEKKIPVKQSLLIGMIMIIFAIGWVVTSFLNMSLQPPQNIKVKIKNNKVHLYWYAKGKSVDYYVIYRTQKGEKPDNKGDVIGESFSTQWVDEKPKICSENTYVIKAVDKKNNRESISSPVTTRVGFYSGSPKPSVHFDEKSEKIEFSWTPAILCNFQKYRISRFYGGHWNTLIDIKEQSANRWSFSEKKRVLIAKQQGGSVYVEKFRFEIVDDSGKQTFTEDLILKIKLIPELKDGQVFRNSLKDGSQGPEMVWIQAGSFRMGDIQGGGRYNEQPVHKVYVKRFAMGRYEVTFAEYDKFAEETGRDEPDDQDWGRGNRPAINVSWNDATAYVEWLSEQTGKQYRLPTEAEWEYAARAGTETKYWWGNSIGFKKANCYKNDCDGDSFQYTAPVGSFAANPFGLYDMVGNVWEWTCSEYDKKYKGKEQQCLGNKSASNGYRVYRGGSWNSDHRVFRNAYRGKALVRRGRDLSLGFRVVLVKEGQVFRDRLKDGSSGPEMVVIPKGRFRMGDIQGSGRENEQPVHLVSIEKFAIGKYEVTVKEFGKFVKATEYKTDAEKETGNRKGCKVYKKKWKTVKDANWRNPYFSQEDTHPVVCVSCNDARAYVQWLSRQTGQKYLLPTEAEWEYTARAGTETKYWWGNEFSSNKANCIGNSFEHTAPVGSFAANPFGLYDTVGNVWEWTCSTYKKEYKGKEQQRCKSKEYINSRVIRGGSWRANSKQCRAANRSWSSPDFRSMHFGFRVVRVVLAN